jgi:hypothetical protein
VIGAARRDPSHRTTRQSGRRTHPNPCFALEFGQLDEPIGGQVAASAAIR